MVSILHFTENDFKQRNLLSYFSLSFKKEISKTECSLSNAVLKPCQNILYSNISNLFFLLKENTNISEKEYVIWYFYVICTEYGSPIHNKFGENHGF